MVERGRPTCQYCGNPIDPEGHACPAMNGHSQAGLSRPDPRSRRRSSAGELELLGLLPNSSNYTFLARATAGDDQVLAVYKPRRGEMPLWDFPEGTLCQREVAAYVRGARARLAQRPADRAPRRPRGRRAPRSCSSSSTRRSTTSRSRGRIADEFRRVALFDVVVNNADRKGGHCLLGPDGTIWVVDHGVCFSDEPKLRTVIWEYVGEPIPTDLLDDVRALRDRLPGADLRAELGALLSPDELAALRRADRRRAARRRVPRARARAARTRGRRCDGLRVDRRSARRSAR